MADEEQEKQIESPSKTRFRKRRILYAVLLVLVAGFLFPQRWRIPVTGASSSDWNKNSFWYYPWGRSGVHKGIDIFAKRGVAVVSAVDGIVLSVNDSPRGGKTVVVLGPRWRFHYYAHLDRIDTKKGRFVKAGRQLGTVGTSGNAKGKAPHLHYTIFTGIPYPWRWSKGPQGWRKMFFLDPGSMGR